MSRRKRNTLLAQITIPSRLPNGVLIPTADPAFLAYCEVDFADFLARYLEDKNLLRLVEAYWSDFRRTAQGTNPEVPTKTKEERRAARADLKARRRAALASKLDSSRAASRKAEAIEAPHESPGCRNSENQTEVAAGAPEMQRHSEEVPSDITNPALETNARDGNSQSFAVDASADQVSSDNVQISETQEAYARIWSSI